MRLFKKSEKQINIRCSRGYDIPAIFHHAKGDAKSVVILSHGIFVDKDENGRFKRLANRLAEAGHASIRYDLSGHGNSAVSSKNTSIVSMASEMQDVIDFARNNYPIPLDIVPSSFSGALFSIYNSFIGPQGCDKIVFLNPVLDFRNVFIEAEKSEMRDLFSPENLQKGWRDGCFDPVPQFTVSRPFLYELSSIDIPSLYEQIDIPHLIIFGTNDELVSYDRAKMISGCNNQSTWLDIDGAEHAFTNEKHEILAHQATIDWLQR